MNYLYNSKTIKYQNQLEIYNIEIYSNQLKVQELEKQLKITLVSTEIVKKEEPIKEQFYRPISSKYKLTSRFGYRRDPINHYTKFHQGVDIPSPKGTKVLAYEKGKVIFSGRKNGYGNCIILKHEDGLETLYGHLSKTNVKKNQLVNAGSIIGLVGSTGRSLGSHLHFEVYVKGKPVNPQKYIK